MNQRSLVLAFVALVCLLAACQDPSSVAQERWFGTSTTGVTVLPVELEFSRLDGILTGSYVVGAARGAFAATLDGEVLTGELRPSEACVYDLNGTVTAAVLDAEFAPSHCPGGKAGSWLLEKE